MKNQKYYCAWHPEKGYNEKTTSKTEEEAWERLADKKVKSFIAFCSQGYGLLQSQGWQVKEVVIVEKDEFDKLTKDKNG
jgi:hypothetical protein